MRALSMAPLVPLGFRFAATAAGIRKDGRIDLALISTDAPASAAGVFTHNLVRAAPVEVAARRVAAGRARAVLVNAGCANACTGEPGMKATLETTDAVASALGVMAVDVLPASTGVIGALLPAEKVVAAIPALSARLSVDGWDEFSRAILTTDRWPKVASTTLAAARGQARVLGIAKGAGMIHPDLVRPGELHATLLSFVLTDANASPSSLERALVAAVDRTFNAASVDGDTSTNDTVIALASGELGETRRERARRGVSEGAVGACALGGQRWRGIAAPRRDRRAGRGERGGGAPGRAHRCDFALGEDGSVRTGRQLGKAARGGRTLGRGVRSRSRENGVAVGSEAERRAAEILARDEYAVTLVLGDGPGAFVYLACDLGHGYVDVNAGYRS
jgi:glutamate N-acetyltransferase/amino-acid N-acetyltransferase